MVRGQLNPHAALKPAQVSGTVLDAACVVLTSTGPLVEALLTAGTIALLVHAVMTLGRRDAVILLVVCICIGFGVENVGLATGFPFGRYAFRLGGGFPQIGKAPLVLGPLYFALAYVAWSIASLILAGGMRPPATRPYLFAMPAVAAVVATEADLVFDPVGATLCGAWIWWDGGADLGVPFCNYLGVLLTFWAILQVFAWLSLRSRRADVGASPIWQAVPPLLFLVAGLSQLQAMSLPDARLVDGTGHAWSAANLRAATATAMLLTMVPTALFAVCRLVCSAGSRAKRRAKLWSTL